MKRLITADAYKWVFDRAEHIRENNPDMDEGESYGIAWKQYKKEYPNWKSKKEKEKLKKKKKKASLEIEALENLQFENEQIYDTADGYVSDIEGYLSNIVSLGDYHAEYDTVIEHYDNIIDCCNHLEGEISKAKDNGITNEQQLGEGADVIDRLEGELEDLQEQLESIRYEHEDLEDEISDLESQIDDIQSQIANIGEDAAVATLNKRLVKLDGRHRYICYAHDSIRDACNDIENDIKTTWKKTDATINQADEDTDINGTLADLLNGLEQYVTIRINSIKSDLSEARDMNGRMGNGINKKDERIEELTDEVEDATNELDKHNGKTEDLKSQLNELRNTLSQLESVLARI